MSDETSTPRPSCGWQMARDQDPPKHPYHRHGPPPSARGSFEPSTDPQESHASSVTNSRDLGEEDRFLVHLREELHLPWRDIVTRFRLEKGLNVQMAALQMRYRRLQEKLREWQERDVRALRLAHEYWTKFKWEIVSSKMLDFDIMDRWPARYCSRKWQELEGVGELTDATSQAPGITPVADDGAVDVEKSELQRRVNQLEAMHSQALVLLASLQEKNCMLESERDHLYRLVKAGPVRSTGNPCSGGEHAEQHPPQSQNGDPIETKTTRPGPGSSHECKSVRSTASAGGTFLEDFPVCPPGSARGQRHQDQKDSRGAPESSLPVRPARKSAGVEPTEAPEGWEMV